MLLPIVEVADSAEEPEQVARVGKDREAEACRWPIDPRIVVALDADGLRCLDSQREEHAAELLEELDRILGEPFQLAHTERRHLEIVAVGCDGSGKLCHKESAQEELLLPVLCREEPFRDMIGLFRLVPVRGSERHHQDRESGGGRLERVLREVEFGGAVRCLDSVVTVSPEPMGSEA